MRQRYVDARKLLDSIEEQRSQVSRLRRSVRSLEEKCTSATSRYGLRTSSESVTQEELWSKLCDRRDALKRQEENLRESERLITQWIDQVPKPRWRMVLRCRYLDGMSMQEIADELTQATGRSFSVYQIYRLHSAALKAAEELWIVS